MARITLKPLMHTFPFVGGFELYFLNQPMLEYSLGGIGTFAEMPGANSIVKTIVEDQIRSRFVWPNKFHLYLPMDLVKTVPNKSFLLSKPAGTIEIFVPEAKNLLRKDKYLTGSGSSDPYITLSIGQRKISFRENYVAKTVNPVWNYESKFVIEDSHGQELKIEVFDYDNSSSDDFLGLKVIDLGALISKQSSDEWITLEDVKHGQIHLKSKWREAKLKLPQGQR